MSGNLRPSWARAEQPILHAVAAAERQGDGPVVVTWQKHLAVELSKDELLLAGARLIDSGHVHGKASRGDGGIMSIAITGLTERGLREVGEWPSEAQLAAALIDAIRQRVENGPESERGNWSKVLTALQGVGLQAAGSVVGAALSSVGRGLAT